VESPKVSSERVNRSNAPRQTALRGAGPASDLVMLGKRQIYWQTRRQSVGRPPLPGGTNHGAELTQPAAADYREAAVVNYFGRLSS
jgi:hypothetical protein